MATEPFRVWAFGDAHVGTDLLAKRESLATALRQSERGDDKGAVPFDWDIAVDVGDMSGALGLPTADEGREIVRQFGALEDHPREAVYSVSGNHDRNAPAEPSAQWWRRWIDPFGEHGDDSGVDPAQRPFEPDGTWERYAFRVGNVVFLMMSDINEPSRSRGRGEFGGNPSGVISGETFAWWQDRLAAHADDIVISVHHYVLRETTVASGPWEGFVRDDDGNWTGKYHGYFPESTPEGASYLYWVDSVANSTAVQDHLASHPGAVDLWLGGHTHTHVEDRCGERSHVETRYGGTHFCNVAALTKWHNQPNNPATPMSRRFTFRPGAATVEVECYLHNDDHAPRGWYEPARRVLPLTRPFEPPDRSSSGHR